MPKVPELQRLFSTPVAVCAAPDLSLFQFSTQNGCLLITTDIATLPNIKCPGLNVQSFIKIMADVILLCNFEVDLIDNGDSWLNHLISQLANLGQYACIKF